MKSRNASTAVIVALCAIVAASGILASNMGFKINYPLNKTGTAGSKSGTNTLALPDVRRTGIVDSFTLMQHIEGGGPPFSKVITVSRFIEETGTLQVYTGRMGSPSPNFPLRPGEGLRIQMSRDVSYVIVGSQDPSLSVALDAVGPASRFGVNDYAPPYNIAATTAVDLIHDIEGVSGPPFGKVISVARFLAATDSLQVYTGRMGSPGANFQLVPGESYRIQMLETVPYVPSHY